MVQHLLPVRASGLCHTRMRMYGIAFDLPRRGLSELTAALLICAITLVDGAILYGLCLRGQNATGQNAGGKRRQFEGDPANSFYIAAHVSTARVSCKEKGLRCTTSAERQRR